MGLLFKSIKKNKEKLFLENVSFEKEDAQEEANQALKERILAYKELSKKGCVANGV